MGTTFAIIDGGGRFSQASTPAETIIFQEAHDGTLFSTPASTSVTNSQADPDGGSNAVLWTLTATGSGLSFVISRNITFGANLIKIRGTFKIVSSTSAQTWMRVRTTSIDAGYIKSSSFRIDTGAAGSTPLTNQTVTDLGSGWYRFYGEIDMTGGGDTTGALEWRVGDADNDQTITNSVSGDHSFYLYKLQVSY